VNAVFDAGALIAVDRRDRRVGAMLRVLQRQGTPLRTSAAAVAQVWRDGPRQANLARVLTGVGIQPLGTAESRRIGRLLAVTRTSDVVDGHVALLVDPGGTVLTSDPRDLGVLAAARQVAAKVVAV
jgi:hypothetical protein